MMHFNKITFVMVSFMLLLSINSFAQWGNELVGYTTSIKVEQGQLIEEESYLIQINNKQSDWIADVAIHYSAGEKLEILEASIVDMNGNRLRKLKKKELHTKSAISGGTFYADYFIKEFKLKWNEYPYRIKYSFRKASKEFLYITKWYPIIDTEVPTRKATLRVEFPLGYGLKFDYPEAVSFKSDTLNNICSLQWEVKQLTPASSELFAPPLYESIPFVSIVPDEFTYGLKGSFRSWFEYGKWQMKTNEGLDLLPLSEQAIVDELIKGIKDKKEIVRILYHYLQDHTRYVNVSIDIGGMKPYPATYVSTNKYGDCKALTIYMKALLKHAGIESYYTDVYAGSNPVKIKPHLPAQQFNHVILSIPIDGDTLWLENTANYLPYNYLGSFTQNRAVFMVSDSSQMTRTPSMGLEEVLEKTTATYLLNEQGEGTLVISRDLKGEAFEILKYFQHQRSEKELQKIVEERYVVPNQQLLNWKVIHPQRDEPLIILQQNLEIKNQFKKLGITLAFSPVALELPELEIPERRKSPLRILMPIHKTDSILYQLPFADKYMSKLPENVNIESKYGRYLERYQQTEGQINLHRTFQLFAGEYPKEEYPAFYAFIQSIKTSQKKSILVLNPR